MADLPTPTINYQKEVRFAVVMYGGVSLAIYINGVAQELLRMVKSTAPHPESAGLARTLPNTEKGEPCGTEKVYRRLSYLVDDPKHRADFRKALRSGAKAAADWQPDSDIRVRFMVDVLAGTSAGGINSIYLAKALANDQNIDDLKNLWVSEGDIHVLINDRKSLKNTTLDRQKTPHSLLNSRRMYLKLLAALDAMDAKDDKEHSAPSPGNCVEDPPIWENGARKRSPLVDELDLYITATDIRGLALPVRLADAVVFERRHKNVFHFKYMTPGATGSDVNEFRQELNPFLAFAARTTSSFPFAFEPVRLSDIRDLLDHSEEHRGAKEKFKPDSPLIRRFFQDNLTQDTEFGSVEYDARSFADGGYLDNKPFSYATSTLSRRTPTVPVDRKLIYVEPSPEHPEREVQSQEPPDAIQNVLAALSLPRYETIREDIQAVLDRNRLIERVNRLTGFIEQDIESFERRCDALSSDDVEERKKALSSTVRSVISSTEQEKLTKLMRGDFRPDLPPKLWNAMLLSDMAGLYGIHYLPYRRLRIAALTDEIAILVSRVSGFDERSGMFAAVRALVQTWRDETYSDKEPRPIKPNVKPEADNPGEQQIEWSTLNRFLNRFDLAYRLRRLNFLVGKIDELLCLFDRHRSELGNSEGAPEILKSEAARTLVRKLEKARPKDVDFNFVKLTADDCEQSIEFLLYLKCELNQSFIKLRKFGRDLRRPPAPNSDGDAQTRETKEPKAKPEESEEEKLYQLIGQFKKKITTLGIKPSHLQLILGVTINGGQRIPLESAGNDCMHPDEAAARARVLWNNSAKYGLDDLKANFETAGRHLDEILTAVLQPSGTRSKQLLDPAVKVYEPNALCQGMAGFKYFQTPFATTARAYLWHHFKHFDDYDQISFPIYFETDVGESDIVEVIRISPEDAPNLINEKTDSRGRKKLAGTRLANFSAFMDAAWRVNDIMWGRLDGAERLIKSMLPDEADKDVRDALTREAHQAILSEELTPTAQADLANLLGQALVQRKAGMAVSDAIDKILRPVDNEVVKQRLTNVMTTCLQADELYTFMRDHYEVNRQFEPEPTLRVLGRATRVINQILEDISKKQNVESKFTKWVARISQIFLGLVEVSVPNSLPSLVFRHFLKLLYAFAIVILVVSTVVLSEPGVADFALKLLALTLGTHFAVFLLRDYMRGRNRWLNVGKALIATVLIALIVIGIQDIRGKNWSIKVVEGWQVVKTFVAAAGSWLKQLL